MPSVFSLDQSQYNRWTQHESLFWTKGAPPTNHYFQMWHHLLLWFKPHFILHYKMNSNSFSIVCQFNVIFSDSNCSLVNQHRGTCATSFLSKSYYIDAHCWGQVHTDFYIVTLWWVYAVAVLSFVLSVAPTAPTPLPKCHDTSCHDTQVSIASCECERLMSVVTADS